MASESERKPYPMFGRSAITHVFALAPKRQPHPTLTDAHFRSMSTTATAARTQRHGVTQNREQRASAQPASTEERPVSMTNRVVSLLISLLVKPLGFSLLLLASDLPGFWSFLLVNGVSGERVGVIGKKDSHQLQLTQKPTLLKKSLRFSIS